MKRQITQLALLIAVLCASVQAYAYDCTVDGIYYNLTSSDNTAEVTEGDGKYEGAIAIPESITYESSSYSVTSIGQGAFRGCSALTSVTIPNSVRRIGEHVFSGCDGLTSVTIGNSVTSIGDGAFSYCSGLTSVTIPQSVTSIGRSAFWRCSGLTSVTIPNSVTSIGEFAFSGCSGLTSVTIPNSVTRIGQGAFRGCSGLTSVTCLAPNPPACGIIAFTDFTTSKCTLYVLKKSVNLYKVAYQWKDFDNVSEYDGGRYHRGR